MPLPLLVELGAALLPGMIGGAEALWGGKPSGGEEDYLKRLKWRMDYGLNPMEISDIGQKFAPMLSRGQFARQKGIARSYAASGGSAGSEAAMAVSSVPGVNEILPGIIADYDLQARTGAEGNYFNLMEMLQGKRQASKTAGYGLMGGSLDQLFGMLGDEEDQLMKLLSGLFGGRLLPDYELPSTAQGTVYEGGQ